MNSKRTSTSAAPADLDATLAPPTVTGKDAIVGLAERSGRSFVPIRRSFVQRPPSSDASQGREGPLATFVRTGDARGLDAWLLVMTATSSEPWNISLPAAVWARALDIEVARPAAAVSKVWKRLERRDLIHRRRSGRQADITVLREDGSGEPYTRPKGKQRADRYLKLDHQYWTGDWYQRLSLAGKAMLLVALAEKPGFQLPYERAPAWYGLSPDTVQRGFDELLAAELINYDSRYRAEPLSAIGYTEVRTWWLQAPFAIEGAGS